MQIDVELGQNFVKCVWLISIPSLQNDLNKCMWLCSGTKLSLAYILFNISHSTPLKLNFFNHQGQAMKKYLGSTASVIWISGQAHLSWKHNYKICKYKHKYKNWKYKHNYKGHYSAPWPDPPPPLWESPPSSPSTWTCWTQYLILSWKWSH